jgi:hypothetical protein
VALARQYLRITSPGVASTLAEESISGILITSVLELLLLHSQPRKKSFVGDCFRHLSLVSLSPSCLFLLVQFKLVSKEIRKPIFISRSHRAFSPS